MQMSTDLSAGMDEPQRPSPQPVANRQWRWLRPAESGLTSQRTQQYVPHMKHKRLALTNVFGTSPHAVKWLSGDGWRYTVQPQPLYGETITFILARRILLGRWDRADTRRSSTLSHG